MTEPAMFDVDFATMLKRYRRRAAVTQRELAARAGLGSAAVRDFEQRRSRQPRIRSVRALAAALNLAPDEATALERAARAGTPAQPTERAGDGPPDTGMPLSVGVLGPLLAHRGAERIDPGAGRHRVVLARLALAPGSAVDPHELIELLWGAKPPTSSTSLLQGAVSQLRRTLQRHRSEDVVRLLPGGYRLSVDADVAAFRALAARARAVVNDPELALTLLGEALDLWRGEPVVDVPELHGSPLVSALVEERIAATLRYADAGAEAGRWSEVLARLSALAAAHPLHESLHARFAVALAATGRQADALRTLQRIRDRLGDELGIDPGPEILDAQRTVLRQEWHRPTHAHPLVPAAPEDFVGRKRELARVVGLVRRPGTRPTVVVLTGPVGVGKSALLLRVGAVVRDDFPDGVVHLDLRPAGRAALTATEALAAALRALGVDAAGLPAEQEAQYQRLLARRRVLVLLDNVAEASQVRVLLPAVGGAVLISSRRHLGQLPGAAVVALGPLAPQESLHLLAAAAGSAWSDVPRADAEALAATCGHLPLALRGVANRLNGLTAPAVGPLVSRLADPDRLLDALSVNDDPIAAHLLPDTTHLSAGCSLAFRMLALVPGPTFSLDAAAATLDVDRSAAEEHLAVLVETNLVRCAPDGRYRYAPLFRRYAQRLGVRADTAAARGAAVIRFYDWMVRQVAVAVYLACPDAVRLRVELPTIAPFDGSEAALAWLDDEMPHLVEAVAEANTRGVAAAAWRLADQMRGYFELRDNPGPRLEIALAAHAAARTVGDPLGLAAAHQCLADAQRSAGRHREALDSYLAGARHAAAAGWVQGEANLWRGAGALQAHLGRREAAKASLQTALRLSDRYRLTRLRTAIVDELGALAPSARTTAAATKSPTASQRR